MIRPVKVNDTVEESFENIIYLSYVMPYNIENFSEIQKNVFKRFYFQRIDGPLLNFMANIIS